MTQASLERQQSEKEGGREEGGLQQTTYTFTETHFPETTCTPRNQTFFKGNLGINQVTLEGLWKTTNDVKSLKHRALPTIEHRLAGCPNY